MKKKLIILISSILILSAASVTCYSVDKARVEASTEPLLAICIDKVGYVTTYVGLFYVVYKIEHMLIIPLEWSNDEERPQPPPPTYEIRPWFFKR
jgi:hypothetical protein